MRHNPIILFFAIVIFAILTGVVINRVLLEEPSSLELTHLRSKFLDCAEGMLRDNPHTSNSVLFLSCSPEGYTDAENSCEKRAQAKGKSELAASDSCGDDDVAAFNSLRDKLTENSAKNNPSSPPSSHHAASENFDSIDYQSTSDVKLLSLFNECMFRSIGAGDNGFNTMDNCVDVGIAWCNKLGIKTSPATQKSSVTGRILVDNQKCSLNLEEKYNEVHYIYGTEWDRYNFAEASGVPYTPLAFDIRTVLGLGKETLINRSAR